MAFKLEVKKVKRSWCVVAGVSVLAKHKTEQQATTDLQENLALFEFWAGSASVSVENTPPVVVNLTTQAG
ncbi:hypothetical protein [Pseudomonas sp. EMN2]|uniref:hypothetical protein n=1 Tax=Pseudomonas sp. EMN2 TaxID=2615212 RepID=UPI00129ABF82|nr:hypothetical protein [Pseudomonas sp. EMN2]